jgi:hypothetical protein
MWDLGGKRGLLGNCEGKREHGRPVLWNGRFMLKLILKKEHGTAGLGSSGSIQEQMAGCFKRGNESSAPIKFGAFLESLWKC